MSNRITESEVLALLHAVERGECRPVFLPVDAAQSARDVYAGNCEWRIAEGSFDGWRIVVFNDCNEWDYIDSVYAPDGRELDFDTIYDTMQTVSAYEPPEYVFRRAWGF